MSNSYDREGLSNGLFFSFVQVHDIFYPFIQTAEDEFTFIWVNESKTGFSHLYKITSLLQPGCRRWTEDYHHIEGKRLVHAPPFI